MVDNLPPLQKLIVLNLAKNKSQTINETVKALSKSYKPTWTAFNSLEKKKLIIKSDTKNYRGQTYPRFWLTDQGMIIALIEGVSANILLQTTKKFYPDAEAAHIFLEMIPYFDSEIIKMAQTYAKGKENLTFAEVAQVILSSAASGLEIEEAKKIVTILKRYPKHYAALKTIIEVMIKQLSYLIEDY